MGSSSSKQAKSGESREGTKERLLPGMDEASHNDVESPMHKTEKSVDGGVKKERASFGRLISLGKCCIVFQMKIVAALSDTEFLP